MSESTGKLTVTVTVYGGTLEDAAKAIGTFEDTICLPGGGEVEFLAAEVPGE